MKLMSPYLRKKEAQKLKVRWSLEYGQLDCLLSPQKINHNAVIIRDRWLCRYSQKNARLLNLDLWRLFRHIMPTKKDFGTANTKKISIVVRRLFIKRHKQNPRPGRSVNTRHVKGLTDLLNIRSYNDGGT